MTNSTNKWGAAYWKDLGERVGATFLGALLATATLTGTTAVDWTDAQAIWAVLGVPTAVSLIKGLLVNLPGDEPSASFADVPSAPTEPVVIRESDNQNTDDAHL